MRTNEQVQAGCTNATSPGTVHKRNLTCLVDTRRLPDWLSAVWQDTSATSVKMTPVARGPKSYAAVYPASIAFAETWLGKDDATTAHLRMATLFTSEDGSKITGLSGAKYARIRISKLGEEV